MQTSKQNYYTGDSDSWNWIRNYKMSIHLPCGVRSADQLATFNSKLVHFVNRIWTGISMIGSVGRMNRLWVIHVPCDLRSIYQLTPLAQIKWQRWRKPLDAFQTLWSFIVMRYSSNWFIHTFLFKVGEINEQNPRGENYSFAMWDVIRIPKFKLFRG